MKWEESQLAKGQNSGGTFWRSQGGFSVIEVMVAMALLGIIGVAFLGALSTAFKVNYITDERTTAESLIRSQVEYVKGQDYRSAVTYDAGVPGSGEAIYLKIDDSGIPEGYTIKGVNRAGDAVENTIYGVPWDSLNDQPLVTDGGFQRIEAVIKHLDKEEVITLEAYKVNR
jgi:prepilin-type N-terminal cleavage/methylation domain-containing protein